MGVGPGEKPCESQAWKLLNQDWQSSACFLSFLTLPGLLVLEAVKMAVGCFGEGLGGMSPALCCPGCS